MKKLIGLLIILTISGAAVPTTIASSHYQKQETIKNSEIDYQQTNNLETLNRDKRQNNSETIINLNKTTVDFNPDGGLLDLSVNLLGNFILHFTNLLILM
ncbi:hypothetical protein [Spiroplasma endosymbiont of Polydrusus formosus]|uniref:hypothetical protein n=1 Tax=Spiroplasma endosymbiont of Polydrusus formosus TaxID=3139326 RepID=UPI0035B56C74